MTDPWFRPKSYGYGATPADWGGWAATAVFAIGLVVSSYLLLGWEPSPGTGASRIAVWALAIAVLIAVFVGSARAKTDGQWDWRWGK